MNHLNHLSVKALGLLALGMSIGCVADTYVDPSDSGDSGDGGTQKDSEVIVLDGGEDAAEDAGDAPSSDTSDAGKSFRRVFVSSSTHGPNFGGLSEADAICTSLATNASLGGNWKAWLSTASTSAASRLEHASVPYELLDGTIVASDWTSLTSGTLLHSIDMTEQKTIVSTDAGGLNASTPWTATHADGTSAGNGYDCNGWTDTTASYSMVIGNVGAVDHNWTFAGSGGCFSAYQLSFFCIEQP